MPVRELDVLVDVLRLARIACHPLYNRGSIAKDQTNFR